MAKLTGAEMAEKFAEFVNVMSHDREEFAEGVLTEHRYLQQEMFNAMLKCIEGWDKCQVSGYYDARNEYAVKASKAMIDGLKEAGLY
jgi:hypothetical protein